MRKQAEEMKGKPVFIALAIVHITSTFFPYSHDHAEAQRKLEKQMSGYATFKLCVCVCLCTCVYQSV